MVSVIIPVYNEEKTLKGCLNSLSRQTYTDFEVIVIDDGSTDKTENILSEFPNSNFKFPINLLKQNHLGPARARNLGAQKAKGNILVFVDADMTFEKNFIKYLVAPIEKKHTKGTFTKEEYVSNWENPWARCWNYNEGILDKRRIPANYPNQSPVFRAILASEFKKVKGFDAIGFTDDWTLSRKLRYKAEASPGAICYHRNPDSLGEVYQQARWIGKNEFITGSLLRKVVSIFRFSLFIQKIKGIYLTIKTGEVSCIVFQLVYGFGVNRSIAGSFWGEHKNK